MPTLFSIRDPRAVPFATLIRVARAYREAFAVLEAFLVRECSKFEPRLAVEPCSAVEHPLLHAPPSTVAPRPAFATCSTTEPRSTEFFSVLEDTKISPEAALFRELSDGLRVLRCEIGGRSHRPL